MELTEEQKRVNLLLGHLYAARANLSLSNVDMAWEFVTKAIDVAMQMDRGPEDE